jgi:hypothetical protein
VTLFWVAIVIVSSRTSIVTAMTSGDIARKAFAALRDEPTIALCAPVMALLARVVTSSIVPLVPHERGTRVGFCARTSDSVKLIAVCAAARGTVSVVGPSTRATGCVADHAHRPVDIAAVLAAGSARVVEIPHKPSLAFVACALRATTGTVGGTIRAHRV